MSNDDALLVICISALLFALTPLFAALFIIVALDDPMHPPRFKAWVAAVSAWWNAKTDRVANFIQDWLIEWDLDNEPRLPKETHPLPPLHTEAFAEAMVPEINQLLDAVAQQINDAPNGTSVGAQNSEVRKILEAWTKRALEVGEQLRIDAATEELPPLNTPHSNWTRKFRRMKAAEGELAAAADE